MVLGPHSCWSALRIAIDSGYASSVPGDVAAADDRVQLEKKKKKRENNSQYQSVKQEWSHYQWCIEVLTARRAYLHTTY